MPGRPGIGDNLDAWLTLLPYRVPRLATNFFTQRQGIDMKRLIGSVLAGMLAIAFHGAQAQGECDKYTTSYDLTYCYSKLFLESDKELNSVYNELRGAIKEGTKKQLLSVQRDWMKYRDQTCQPTAGTINVDCNYDVNRKRSEYLRDRLRECKSGTCRDDMIGSKSWS